MFKFKNVIVILISAILIGCGNNIESEDMVTIELFEKSTDKVVIESKMSGIFEVLGEEYEYKYEDNTITLTIPRSKADIYIEAIEDDVASNIRQAVSDGYLNDMAIKSDFTEIKMDISTLTSPELADTMGWYFINMAITYQGFNGVLKDDMNVNVKSYIDGVFNSEININSKS